VTFNEFRDEVRRRVEKLALAQGILYGFDPDAFTWSRGALTMSLGYDGTLVTAFARAKASNSLGYRTSMSLPRRLDDDGIREMVTFILHGLLDPYQFK
jgi:hypothetical protein